jgi:transposase
MIQLTPHMRILVAIKPLDFRKGVDSIASYCKYQLQQNPYSGVLFAFRNKAGTAIKILAFDGCGMYLVIRRFSRGKLAWWPHSTDQPLQPLAAQQLAMLLAQGNPMFAAFPEDWRKIG